jgi:hypothetical protein
VEREDACLVQSQPTVRSFDRKISSRPSKRYDAGRRPKAKLLVADWRYYYATTRTYVTGRPQDSLVFARAPYAIGASGGLRKAFSSRISHGLDGRLFSPPRIITTVKSIACEVPAKREQPLSRLFIPDIQRILVAERHVDSISCSTIWRILDADAIKPWRHRSWIWSRDPLFAERAGLILDLYERMWNGRRFGTCQ